jgi:hypothetical protein
MSTTAVRPALLLARPRESTSNLHALLLQRSGWQAAGSNGDLGRRMAYSWNFCRRVRGSSKVVYAGCGDGVLVEFLPASYPRQETASRRRMWAVLGMPTRRNQKLTCSAKETRRKYPVQTKIQWKPGNSNLNRRIENVCFGSVSNMYHEFYK